MSSEQQRGEGPAPGLVFHDLTLIRADHRRRGGGFSCTCRCVCGATVSASLSALRGGFKRSCGCTTGEVYRRTRRMNDRDATMGGCHGGR